VEVWAEVPSVSDMSQGHGWWIASDGKWYPPEQHPHFVHAQQEHTAPTVGVMPQQSATGGSSAYSGPPRIGPFVILNVVPEGTPPSYLFPGPGSAPDTVVIEPEDGANLFAFRGTAMSVALAQGGD